MTVLKKKRFSNLYQIIKSECRLFCSNTALHGYKYAVDHNSSALVRYTWIFIILSSCAASIFLLYASWQSNTQHPVETVADSVHNPIWNYQFPAVTICNLNKVSLRKLESFIGKIQDPVNFDRDYIKTLINHLVKILYLQYDPTNIKYYNDMQMLIDANNFTVQDIMLSIRPSCNSLLRSCIFKGRNWRCNTVFEENISSEGLCCSSNYFGWKHNPSIRYFSQRYKTKPRRMSSCGYQSGYKILINNNLEDYFIPDIPGYGTKILIHDSYDYPSWSSTKELLNTMEEAFISVIPELTYSTDVVKSVPISDRNCIFPKEKSLKYFKYYSQLNCLTECRINMIRNTCNCIPLYFWELYSQEFNTSNNYACNIKTASCAASVSDILGHSMPTSYNRSPNFDFKSTLNLSLCECLPSCEERTYKIETSKTSFSPKHIVNNIQFFKGINGKNHSVLDVYFKDLVAMRLRKDISISWYSELALFGGVLGICLGFSFTSGFEILYYLTVRSCINYYIYKKKSKNLNRIHQNHINSKIRKNRVAPINNISESYAGHTVPPLRSLYNLKKTNNYWYVD